MNRNKIITLVFSISILFNSYSCKDNFSEFDNDYIDNDKNYFEIGFLNSKIRLVNKTRAETLLKSSDPFTRSLSILDTQCRLNKESISSPESEYLNYASKQAENWEYEDVQKVIEIFQEIEQKIEKNDIKMNLPSVIEVLKTNLSEEAGPYTRSNYIVFGNEVPNISIIAHELWHVYSRHNSRRLDDFYKIIGFEKSPNEIIFPEDLITFKITNPDAPFMNYCIKLTNKKLGNFYSVPIIYGAKYDGRSGGIFSYVLPNINKLLVLEHKNGKLIAKKGDNGKSLVLNYSDTNIYSKIGMNTSYQIHPEEITAEHFSFIFKNDSSNDYTDYNLIEDLENELKKIQ